MWRSRNNRDGTTVVCIACGTSLPRSEAREYDKHGNRWERHGKTFEHLCKECYRDLCHQPRADLESLLIDLEREASFSETDAADEDDDSRAAFLARYFTAVEERSSSAEEQGRES
ncbi:DUF7562 family protein [Halobellus clavatus]|jgi:hypothetical protein|uniref:Small CPxCG-related zinc finger protein n=1 Tax=Halobellus clavatus TaxID=660517 RepID=A0A1H3ENB7_9EURY|nr:hypothetical protein [Halobellus clavatus]SDX80110.1 hypothetical protein SAMN04487946_102401 [Halobellus clavatus]